MGQKHEDGAARLANDLVAFVPLQSAERLAGSLTPDDVDTLRALARAAASPNTLRSVASDLGYLEAWHAAAYDGARLPWPAPDETALRFVSHHLFLAAERERNPSHGMPAGVEAALRTKGTLRGSLPHAPSTVSRRLSSWRTLHAVRGHEDALGSKALRLALRAATTAQDRPPKRKSRKPVTRDVLDRLVGTHEPTPWTDVRTLRDNALLLVAFASGGRRRSELGRLLIERIERTELVQDDGSVFRGVRIALGRTKTSEARHSAFVVVTGRPLRWLEAWLDRLTGIDPHGAATGPIFRPIDRWGNVGRSGLTGDAVADVLKGRCKSVGLDAADYSAHGLRSGYMTEASLRGVPIEAAMRYSLHRTVQAAQRYFDDQQREAGAGARLAD
ncbi:tyrosine-type recombinase/integrase [Parvularcula oceani]|uniref:tyrosine-type recombinase/integrase n=1 Tax=Parvularcula oceani TaxID=1247963 RepID=UPI0005668F79|nr:tyrosine-type recombinase/integrase [Parvularcula oceani]